jgi:hypothetical protein
MSLPEQKELEDIQEENKESEFCQDTIPNDFAASYMNDSSLIEDSLQGYEEVDFNFNERLVENELKFDQGNASLQPNRYAIEDFEAEVHRDRHSNHHKRVSFFKAGKPRDEEDILKIESPFYASSTTTVIKRMATSNKNVNQYEKKSTRNLANKPNSNEQSQMQLGARRNALVDVKLANKMEVRHFKSLFMTILQIINTIIRYTIVQFPFVIKTLGLIYGPIAIFIVGCLSLFSVYMLIKVKQHTGGNSYSMFAHKWWGMKGKVFIIILSMISSLGSCLSYISKYSY